MRSFTQTLTWKDIQTFLLQQIHTQVGHLYLQKAHSTLWKGLILRSAMTCMNQHGSKLKINVVKI